MYNAITWKFIEKYTRKQPKIKETKKLFQDYFWKLF